MTNLYIAWQDRHNREWYPVGRLTRYSSEPVEYAFHYLHGAREAKEAAPHFVIPVPGFPEFQHIHRSRSVFSMFRYRAMNPSRPDRPEYLRSLGLDPQDADTIEELAVSGGRSIADRFETFPAIQPDPDGEFRVRFVVHGLRADRPSAIERINALTSNDRLLLDLIRNGHNGASSLGVRTEDQQLLGWLPRYLVDVLFDEHGERASGIELRVVQVNHSAPLDHRLLVELSGKFPRGVDPMGDLEMYQPIAGQASHT